MEDTLNAPAPTAPGLSPPRVWSALGAIALYFVIQLVTAIAVAFVVMAIRRFTQPHIDVRHLLHDPATTFMVIGIALPVSCLASLLIFRAIFARRWRVGGTTGIGLIPIRASSVTLHVLLGLVAAMVGGALTYLFSHGHPVHQDIAQIVRQAPAFARWLIILSAVTVIPLAEEILFRGLLLPALLRHMPVAAAVILDACLFALMHLPDLGWKPQGLAALALVGLLCCWRRLKTGSIYSSVAVHAGNNLLAMIGLLMLMH